MKKIFLALALCAAVSCSNKANQAQECAQNFLDAFLANDFETAVESCSENFRPGFSATIDNFRNLDESIKEIIRSECAKYRAEITSVERINESDTFQVAYTIVKVQPDTLSKIKEGAINSTLMVVGGKVEQLNRLP